MEPVRSPNHTALAIIDERIRLKQLQEQEERRQREAARDARRRTKIERFVKFVLKHPALKKLPPSHQVVYFHLTHLNDLHQGPVFRSRPKLADETGLSQKTIRRALRALEDRRLIQIKRDKAPSGLYYLDNLISTLALTTSSNGNGTGHG